VLWEEGKINPDKHNREVGLSSCVVKSVAGEERESVDEAGHDSKHGPHGQDVVEVGNYVVGVVEDDV